MKYSLIHCYTDKNKGDAAIIIATTQLLNDVDKNADISLFSTYGLNDARLESDHNIIKKYANRIYPGCFYEAEIPFNFKHDKWRVLTFLWIFLKSLLMLISKNKYFLSIFLKKEEVYGIKTFLDSDVIISKGGSFLVTENSSLRQTLSLIRMLYPFILATRYNKKIVIFSQSLGPVEGKFNKWLFEKVLSSIDTIYLRESLCIENYDSVEKVCEKVHCEIIPDTAFYLKADDDSLPIDIKDEKYNVGYTLVDHDFKYVESVKEVEKRRENYKNSIISSMKYLVDMKEAEIHIFPQVRVDISFLGHNDMKISQEIQSVFKGTKYEKYVHFYNENWTPIQLRNLYERMDIFIGTRLHSVIFSLSVGTPSINIAYHGTKSQGILAGISDLKQYVVDINTIEETLLINKIQNLLENHSEIQSHLQQDISEIKEKLYQAMKQVCKN